MDKPFNLLLPVPTGQDGTQGTALERFETIIARPECRVERIVSHGHVTPDGQWYDQVGDEWVVVVEGAAELQFADSAQTVKLGRGDCLLIAAHRKHRVIWTTDEQPTVWLAIHFSAESTGNE